MFQTTFDPEQVESMLHLSRCYCVGPLALSMPSMPAMPPPVDQAVAERERKAKEKENLQRQLNAKRSGNRSLLNPESKPSIRPL
jgi:hypothetical protein